MTIRLKVTMAAIAVILVANSRLALVGLEYAQRVWLREVQSRVRLDLGATFPVVLPAANDRQSRGHDGKVNR